MPIDPSRTCKYCKSSELSTFSTKERMFGMTGDFTYQECQDCLSIQVEEVPADLGSYYSEEDYYSFIPLVQSRGILNFFKTIRLEGFLKHRLAFLQPKVYGYWLQKVFSNFDAKIADIGCGNGQLLYELHAGGFKNLIGFDPFLKESQKIVEGLNLVKSELKDSQEKFDLIMYHHAFEHLQNPQEELKVCWDRLNPGGKALIRLPVTDSKVWKEERTNWVQLDAPRHLTIPSVKGITSLAQSVGFIVESVEFDSSEFQFWGTALYKMGLTLKEKPEQHFSEKQMVQWKKKALLYNEEGKGDQICLYLSKSK